MTWQTTKSDRKSAKATSIHRLLDLQSAKERALPADARPRHQDAELPASDICGSNGGAWRLK